VASPFIHDTVRLIRAVFTTAIEKAPSIVFIDEFEAFVPAARNWEAISSTRTRDARDGARPVTVERPHDLHNGTGVCPRLTRPSAEGVT
jgi:hypothetical protein